MNTKLIGALCVLLPVAAPAAPIKAETGPSACIELLRIDHTHVLDDQNILFYMRGEKIYLNQLLRPAHGLDQNQPFAYRTSIGQLCKGDIITVLEPWGFGFTEGASTTLGTFTPIDEARADTLRGEHT